MEVLAYEGPDGELTLRPSVETLAPFFDMGPDYWQGGSGSAYIGWIKERSPGYSTRFDRPVLHIIFHEPYGVCLTYEVVSYQPGVPGMALMTYNDLVAGDLLVEHYLGGEAAYLPRRSFVRKEAAVRVAAAFLQTQKPSAEVMWRPRRGLEYAGYGYVRGR